MNAMTSCRIVVVPIVLALSPLWTTRSEAQAAPASTQLTSITLPPELDRVLRDYERAWQARDAKALTALFTADGLVLQPGKAPARGSAAIENAYRGAGGPLALRAIAYATADTVGYIIGAYAGKAGDPDSGKFTLTLRRARGAPWRIMSDMDNGNTR